MRNSITPPHSPYVVLTLTAHATRQAQRRGIRPRTLDLIVEHADRSCGLPGRAKGIWISRAGRDRLIRNGLAAADVDRAAGVHMVVKDDNVLTVEHATARRVLR